MNKDNKYVPLHPIHTKEMQTMGFDLMDLESKSGKRYDSSVAHRYTFFELFLFTGGKGVHEIDFHHYPALKNTGHFISPGQIHKLTLRNTTGYVFCFTEDFSLLKPKEMSFYLNFEDVAYFNRFFKKHTQLTPNGYRIQSQEKSLKSARL